MPSYKDLKVGDKIIISSINKEELDYHTSQGNDRKYYDDGGATTLEVIRQLIDTKHIVTIYDIDEYGYPWFMYEYKTDNNEVQEHTMAVMHDDTWHLSEA